MRSAESKRPWRTEMNKAQNITAAACFLSLAISIGLFSQSWMDQELDHVRRMRVTIDTQNALQTGRALEGQLTIVKETKSAKYHFLNKRSYAVHTSSVTRVGTVLRGRLQADKARADRHSDARRTVRPVVERMASGSYRVTIAKDLRSAEIQASPDLSSPAFSWPGYLSLSLFLGFLGFTINRKRHARFIWPGFALFLGLLAGSMVHHYQGQSVAAANAFLREDGRRAPHLMLPVYVLWSYFSAIFILGFAAVALVASDRFAKTLAALKKSSHAYLAIGPAMLGLSVLVGIPFFVGMGLAFFRHVHGEFSFVGLQNFNQILQGGEGPHSIFYTLLVTVIWTLLNVTLHLGIGLGLALLLHRHSSGWNRIYRVILIIPWAVPAYLTALIWRSMFDADVGVINRMLGLEGMSWMHDTFTAFVANLVTNVWLGFPFMMVVCLGALTSIPKDLYDAADVDGANSWQAFTQITLPLLKPALLPAIILGSIWTFNKFEVIYLVSEGRPDGGTDILVTEAYRWAFERGLAQGGAYGKAAACSVLIFVVLLLYGWMTARVSRSAEEALR
jgi:ABC-type sugar transport system permease subunit